MEGKILALVSVVAVAMGSVVLASPPVRRFLSPQGGDENVYDAKRDPVAGFAFPLPKEDAFGRRLPSAQKTIVVIAGVCTSCSLHAIDPREVEAPSSETVVFAYQSGPKELQPWMRDLPPNVRVVCDESRMLQQASNSVWQPRYVVLDERLRVADLSRDDAGVPDYIHLRRAG